MRRRDRRRFPILLAERPGPVTKLRLKPPSEKLDAAPRTFVTRSAAAAAAKTASKAETCLIRTDSGFRRCLDTVGGAVGNDDTFLQQVRRVAVDKKAAVRVSPQAH